jgi:hypothetical protein
MDLLRLDVEDGDAGLESFWRGRLVGFLIVDVSLRKDDSNAVVVLVVVLVVVAVEMAVVVACWAPGASSAKVEPFSLAVVPLRALRVTSVGVAAVTVMTVAVLGANLVGGGCRNLPDSRWCGLVDGDMFECPNDYRSFDGLPSIVTKHTSYLAVQCIRVSL